MPNALSLQAEALKTAGSLPGLMLAAEQVAKTVQSGAHGRKRAGTGESFWQFRDYDPTEAAANIDWRQSAKRDRLSVREQEWDAVQTAFLWLDDTASMKYGSNPNLPTKLDAARVLALALTALLVRGGEAVGTLDRVVKAGLNMQKSEEIANWLIADRNQDLPVTDALPANAQQVWFSDFLGNKDKLRTVLSKQTAMRQKGVLVQIIDPAEAALPFKGRVRFQGLKGEDDWLVQKTEGVKDSYADRWKAHLEELTALTKAAGWRLVHVMTDQPQSQSLIKIQRTLSAQGALSA